MPPSHREREVFSRTVDALVDCERFQLWEGCFVELVRLYVCTEQDLQLYFWLSRTRCSEAASAASSYRAYGSTMQIKSASNGFSALRWKRRSLHPEIYEPTAATVDFDE